MVKLPDPPSSRFLANLGLSARVLPAGTELWRVHFLDGGNPGSWNSFRYFGPVISSQFDHHVPPPHRQDRGIIYTATEVATCIAEVFQRTRVVSRKRNAPWLAGFALERDLELHDLSGTWPTAAGASMALNTGPHFRTQRWSRAIYGSYPGVQGLWYCSSMHANLPALALFERSEPALPRAPFFHRALADPVLLNPLRIAAGRLGYWLV